MQQIKLFKSVETEVVELQRQINDWLNELQQAGGTVIQVTGNIAPQTVSGGKSTSLGGFKASDLFVIVLYEQGS